MRSSSEGSRGENLENLITNTHDSLESIQFIKDGTGTRKMLRIEDGPPPVLPTLKHLKHKSPKGPKLKIKVDSKVLSPREMAAKDLVGMFGPSNNTMNNSPTK